MSQEGIIDILGTFPQIPTDFVTDSGTAIPILNTLEILGTNGITTSGSGNTVTITGINATAGVNVGASQIGVAAFNSAQFTVTAGFVSLVGGGGAIDSIAVQTGTSPIVPDGTGLVTINGAVVAAGTNPVRTNGTGANTMALQVQISQALAATDATKIGLSNFDSAAFDVDANGFVQLNGGGIASTSFDVQANTAPGTDPVLPTAAGVVTVNGAVVANHSVVLETRSRAANAYNLEVQYATSAAATDGTKSGVAHFDSADFTVDASGFVSASGTGIGQTITGNTGGALSPSAGNWTVVTSNATPVFAGSGSTLTQNFNLSNLVLGSSLPSLTSGTANVGMGATVMAPLTSGANNTSMGNLSMQTVSSSASNSCYGYGSGRFISTGTGVNSFFGASSGGACTTGTSNSGFGQASLSSLQTGSYNIALGQTTGTAYTGSESSNIVISNDGVIGESNTIRIGEQGSGSGQQNRFFAAGIASVVVANTQMVTIDTTTGQMGSQAVPSSSGITEIAGDSGTPTSGPTVTFNGGIALTTSNGLLFDVAGTTVTLNYAFLNLPETDASGNGILYMEDLSDRYTMLHAGDQGLIANNFFAGQNAGNITLSPGASGNTGIGPEALNSLTTGAGSTCVGFQSGFSIDVGNSNDAFGSSSLFSCEGGDFNVAIGQSSLGALISGNNNCALGLSAGIGITSGEHNTCVGHNTLAVGNGDYNIVIGDTAGVSLTATESSNILINSPGVAAESNAIRIGTQGSGAGEQDTCYIAGIASVSVSNTEMVTIDTTTGQLGSQAIPGGSSLTWTDTTATTLAVNNAYNGTAAGTYPMPATAAQGDLIIVFCDTSGAVVLDCPASNFIRIGSSITSSGGTMTSSSQGDSVTLYYRLSSLTWEATASMGNWTPA